MKIEIEIETGLGGEALKIDGELAWQKQRRDGAAVERALSDVENAARGDSKPMLTMKQPLY